MLDTDTTMFKSTVYKAPQFLLVGFRTSITLAHYIYHKPNSPATYSTSTEPTKWGIALLAGHPQVWAENILGFLLRALVWNRDVKLWKNGAWSQFMSLFMQTMMINNDKYMTLQYFQIHPCQQISLAEWLNRVKGFQFPAAIFGTERRKKWWGLPVYVRTCGH
jgi:hypothetical protein